MKRVLLILLLFVLLIAPAFSRGSLQGAKPVRLGVIVDGPWERNEELWGLLQKGIQDVLGNNTQVIFPRKGFLVGDWTLAGVHALGNRLLDDPDIDVILGMGLITSHDLATRGPLPKPVIAPIIVDPERQHVPFKDGKSGVKNLSYLIYPQTFDRDLKFFQEIVPIKKLVNIASKRYDEVLPPPRVTMEELGRRLGLEVTELFIDVSADDVLKALPKDADAVFVEPSLQVPQAEFLKLARGFVERRLPSFSTFGESDVRAGIMASANPDVLPRLVRRIAMHVQRILEGEEPGSLTVAFTPGKRLTINLNTAYAVGVSPSWSVLLEAELVQVDTLVPGGLSITLADAIRRCSEENLDVQADASDVNAGAENVVMARSVLLPRVDLKATGLQIDKERAQAGAQPQRSGTLDLSASQVIFSEPALANVSIQSSLQESRIQHLAITRSNAIVEGSTHYINYLRARKLYSILLENLKLTRTNLELARVRNTTGAAGPEESLRWEVEIANLRKVAMDMQAQMNQALLALKQVLNIPLLYQLNVSEVSVDDPALLISDKDLQSYLDDPLSFDLLNDFLAREGAIRSPALRQLGAVIDAQERLLTSSRLGYFLPSISAFGTYANRFYASEIASPFQLPSLSSAPPPGTAGEAFLYQLLGSFSPVLPADRNWSVGIQLSLNIFNGFTSKASTDQAAYTLQRYRLQKKSLTDRVALLIRADMERVKASHFAIQQAELEQSAARRTLEIVMESYSRGAVSILNLLDAQNSALRADQVASNAVYDFMVDYVSLQGSIGEFDVLMTAGEREDLLQRLKDFMAKTRRR